MEDTDRKRMSVGSKQILISGYRGTQCGEEIVPDRISGQGPFGGLESCFRRAKTEKCLVLGVDARWYLVEELKNLLKFAQWKKTDQTGDYAVVIMEREGSSDSGI